MPNYQQGKIYCIRSHQTDEIYIGSTTKKYLSERLAKHKLDYRSYLNKKYHYVTSFKILEYEDAYIELIELFPCNSKDELTRQEGKHQREMDCVNKNIAGRTQREYRENNREKIAEKRREYRENNKDKIAEKQREYRENNREQLAEKKREYYQDNKDKIAEKQQEYYQDNKDKIIEKHREYRENNKDKIAEYNQEYRENNREHILKKHTCDCGGKYITSHKSRHFKTNKHKKYLDEINNNTT